MKKKWSIVAGIVVLLVALATVAFADTPIKLVVNGQEIKPDMPPQIINGRTMVPVRWVADALGADVQWDDKNKTVIINKEEKLKNISMLYIQPEYKKRFVKNELHILLLPLSGSPQLNIIRPNTVVDVNDVVQVESFNREVWLYVTIPVYDSAMNMKGWIKEADTVPLTKENQKLVQNVTIKKGTPVYETFEFENISSLTPVILEYDKGGRLVKKKEGFFHLSCPGGLDIWVSEQYIVYPEVE